MKQLVLTPHGTAQLLASNANPAKILWNSDDDEAFVEFMEAEDADGQVIDPDDEDQLELVTEYLIESELVREGENIDVIPHYLDNEDEDE